MDSWGLLRGLGFREVANGVAILWRRNTAPLLWARVAGDALDIALLGRALVSEGHERDRVAAALMAVIGVTILDTAAARQLAQANANAPTRRGRAATRTTKTVTVNRPRVEVYRFWRNLQNTAHGGAVGRKDDPATAIRDAPPARLLAGNVWAIRWAGSRTRSGPRARRFALARR